MSIRPNRAAASATSRRQSASAVMSAAKGRGPAAPGFRDQAAGFLGPAQVAVHADEARPFAGEEQGGGAAVADGLAGRLAGFDDNGGLSLQSAGHGQG